MAAWTEQGQHPVLQTQAMLNGNIVSEPSSFFSELGEAIDETPRFVAGIVLGGALVLFGLKKLGIRFNFGVGAKVG